MNIEDAYECIMGAVYEYGKGLVSFDYVKRKVRNRLEELTDEVIDQEINFEDD